MKFNLDKSWLKTLSILTYSNISEKTLFDKLAEKFCEIDAQTCVKKARDFGLINEEKSIISSLYNYINQKKLSDRAAKRKLILKGYKTELIDVVFEENFADFINEQERIRHIFTKKYAKKYENCVNSPKDKKKLTINIISYFLRLEFNKDNIKQVMDIYNEIN
ncbi:MAG: regulatory protein RecX [Candidatus Improbicoccus devescovinae]|nr:MAG: regulatory protein RecX [Candidatus Improbicoccus devescovinae]